MLIWLCQQEVSLEVINENLYPDVITLNKKEQYIQELIEAGFLSSTGKINNNIRERIFEDKGKEIPAFKTKDISIYNTFADVFGIKTNPSYPLEQKIKTLIKNGATVEAINGAIVTASQLEWLAKYHTKGWFGLMWMLCRIEKFMPNGEYAEKKATITTKESDNEDIDFGV